MSIGRNRHLRRYRRNAHAHRPSQIKNHGGASTPDFGARPARRHDALTILMFSERRMHAFYERRRRSRGQS